LAVSRTLGLASASILRSEASLRGFRVSLACGDVLRLICLFRRCCISNEVGGEVLSLVTVFSGSSSVFTAGSVGKICFFLSDTTWVLRDSSAF
jgi:hypothetical protein